MRFTSRGFSTGVGTLTGLLFAGLFLGSCTFEHRGSGNDDEEVSGPAYDSADERGALPAVPADPESAVLDVVRTFREATARGDLSLALSLMSRDAFMTDALVGGGVAEQSRGEMLLELRALMAEGFSLSEGSVRVHFPGAVAVAFAGLTLEAEAEEPAGRLSDFVGRAVYETVVLVSTEQGWRIQHLHRSVAP